MTKNMCSAAGCEKDARTKGMCKVHYNKARLETLGRCTIGDCEAQQKTSGMCWKHYERKRTHGDPNTLGPRKLAELSPRSVTERFWRKVEKTDTCWNFRCNSNYGSIRVDGKQLAAHRYSYAIHRGEIPEGMVIDHLCRNTRCVNPDHLEAVSLAENSRRAAKGKGLAWVCSRGHAVEGKNRRSRKDGTTYCGLCANLSLTKSKRRARAEAEARAWVEENEGDPAVEIINALLDREYLDISRVLN